MPKEYKIFNNNGTLSVKKVNGSFHIASSGDILEAPLFVSGWYYENTRLQAVDDIWGGFFVVSDLSITPYGSKTCAGRTNSNPETAQPIRFRWNSIRYQYQDKYRPDFYMIYNIPTAPLPSGFDNNAPSGIAAGYHGAFVMYHHPQPGAENVYYSGVWDVGSFHVDELSGTGSSLVAKTYYQSGSLFYDKYKINTIEISSGCYPKFTFDTPTYASGFHQQASSLVDFGFLATTGTYAGSGYSFLYSFDFPALSPNNLNTYYDSSAWTLNGNEVCGTRLMRRNQIDYPGPHVSGENDLLSILEQNGTKHTYLYLNLFVHALFNERACDGPGMISFANPLILRTHDLEKTQVGWPDDLSGVYEFQHNAPYYPACDVHSFVMNSVNDAGLGIYIKPEDINLGYLSTAHTGFLWLGSVDAGFDGNYIKWVTESPATNSTYWSDGNGNVWSLLSLEARVHNYDGTTDVYSAWDSPGTCIATEPAGWYYVTVSETWRISGPSAEPDYVNHTTFCGGAPALPYVWPTGNR